MIQKLWQDAVPACHCLDEIGLISGSSLPVTEDLICLIPFPVHVVWDSLSVLISLQSTEALGKAVKTSNEPSAEGK